MAAEFDGKVAIVTGGATGIGAACARQLAAGDARGVVADLHEEPAAQLAVEIGGAAFLLDVSDPARVEAMVAFYESLVALHPIGRLGTAEEVAELACFLLSDRTRFINGSYHLVDDYTAR
jgi:NAD(P)-dependent dehydrogenase (short-subunit alcohol dehydrogenase family)